MAEETIESSGTEKPESEAKVEGSPAGESEQTVPVAKHAALRKRAQTAELGQARAEGAVAALQQMQTTKSPATKSPIDLEIERQTADGVDEADVTITPALYRKQKLYEAQVANQAAEAEATQTLRQAQAASSKVSMAVHDDFTEVVTAGDALLTRGERLDVESAGDNFGEVAYAKCKAAIERNKPAKEKPAAPELSEQEKKEAEEKKAAENKEAPSQADVLANASDATAKAFNL